MIIGNFEVYAAGGASCEPKFPCKACDEEPQKCTECITGTGREGTPTCKCRTGFYQLSKLCTSIYI